MNAKTEAAFWASKWIFQLKYSNHLMYICHWASYFFCTKLVFKSFDNFKCLYVKFIKMLKFIKILKALWRISFGVFFAALLKGKLVGYVFRIHNAINFDLSVICTKIDAYRQVLANISFTEKDPDLHTFSAFSVLTEL